METTKSTAQRAETATISEGTRKFIVIKAMVTDLYAAVCDAIETVYGELQVDDLIKQDFDPLLSQLDDKADKYIIESISGQMGSNTFTQI